MGEEQYIWSADKDQERELARLRWQERLDDPPTIRHLETLGVSGGWKCLEVGAGAGSIAQWLSKRVGENGTVVATDIDTRFLQPIAARNLTIRVHNILKDDLEKNEYDLVHCRKVLHHLSEYQKAVKRMADAVRPGGWLLLEEDDWGSALSADITDPSTTQWTAMTRIFLDYLRKKGMVDFYFGRRVRSLVEGTGFLDVSQEGWTFMIHGGDSRACYLAAAGQVTTRLMVEAGLCTREQAEEFLRIYYDPSFDVPGYTIFSAWGRKPAEGGT